MTSSRAEQTLTDAIQAGRRGGSCALFAETWLALDLSHTPVRY